MSLDSKVSALTAALRSEFWKAWDQVAEPAPYEDFTTEVDSTTLLENFINATPVPGFSRWTGERSYQQTDTFLYQVRNETYYSALQATLEQIEDDQTGILMMQPKFLAEKGKEFPGRMVLKLLGQAAGSPIALATGAAGNTNAFDGLPFFGNRAEGSAGFGVGNNLVAFTAASGDGLTYNLAALFYGNKPLKPLCWQRRSGPDFETNSGDKQSKESRNVRWWCDLRGAPFFSYFWNAVLVQITNTPSVAEMHAIFAKVTSAFRKFRMPRTSSAEDGEYVHEQAIFGQDNMYYVASTGLSEQLEQALTQDWIPQQVGGNTVATTNKWKGKGKYLISVFMDNQ